MLSFFFEYANWSFGSDFLYNSIIPIICLFFLFFNFWSHHVGAGRPYLSNLETPELSMFTIFYGDTKFQLSICVVKRKP